MHMKSQVQAVILRVASSLILTTETSIYFVTFFTANMDLVPFAGYISDDSDFYGTPKVRRKLQAHSKKTTTKQLVQRWDRDRAAHPAAFITLTSSNIVEQTLYNRLEGVPTARQLDETVDEFLKRLPPRT
ncbi:hypothetical protein KCU73_g18140, partial [Aureobasidium melanogenum]